MLIHCLYPTDTKIDDVILSTKNKKILFVSLHMPEAPALFSFTKLLKNLHQTEGFTYFADISPLTLSILNIHLEDLSLLKSFGITGLRIDFGFTVSDILRISKQGFKIAVNASTITKNDLDDLSKIDLIGWHNYYPRPATGLTTNFFNNQNLLINTIYTFIPGEQNFRKPLCMGLPTLENQRYLNTYVNYLFFAINYPNLNIVLAESTCFKNHKSWIDIYEQTKVITIPIVLANKEVVKLLEGKTFKIRIEDCESSFRVEQTRGMLNIQSEILRSARKKGTLQMDLYGRYDGELHLLKKDLPPDGYFIRVGEIPTPYLSIIDVLKGGNVVNFVFI